MLAENQDIKNTKWFLFFAIAVFFMSCVKNENQLADEKVYHYLHLSHTRLRNDKIQKVDPRVEQIELENFDMVMLGGDLCENSSEDIETLKYLDTIFNLDSPTVLWSIGNHDAENVENIKAITKKPTNYAYHKNGITFLVLNTQNEIDWKCYLDDSQIELVRNVTDTIGESSHLIVLTHNLLWLLEHPELKGHTDMGNLYNWACNKGVLESNWNEEVLPLLKKVKEKEVEVICLAGDIGNNVKTFEHFGTDGITYLASGINPVDSNVKILLFRYQPPELVWQFVELEKFLEQGQKFDFKGHNRPEGK